MKELSDTDDDFVFEKERAQCGRLRRELEEAEGGGEAGAATIVARGHGLLDDLIRAQQQ